MSTGVRCPACGYSFIHDGLALESSRRSLDWKLQDAVKNIAALEAEVKSLHEELERKETYASSLENKVSTHNPMWMMEE
jgi:predicted  nucleic acid-binding Zn-ribbon protein